MRGSLGPAHLESIDVDLEGGKPVREAAVLDLHGARRLEHDLGLLLNLPEAAEFHVRGRSFTLGREQEELGADFAHTEFQTQLLRRGR